jgi:hypothetical protein
VFHQCVPGQRVVVPLVYKVHQRWTDGANWTSGASEFMARAIIGDRETADRTGDHQTLNLKTAIGKLALIILVIRFCRQPWKTRKSVAEDRRWSQSRHPCTSGPESGASEFIQHQQRPLGPRTAWGPSNSESEAAIIGKTGLGNTRHPQVLPSAGRR